MTEEQQRPRIRDPESPATDAQRDALIKLGVDPNAANDPRLTKGRASQWIDEAKAERAKWQGRLPDAGAGDHAPGFAPASALPRQSETGPPLPHGETGTSTDTAAKTGTAQPVPAPPPLPERPPMSGESHEPETAVAIATTGVPASVKPTAEQVRLLKSAGKFPQNASSDEIAFGFAVATRLGLDPLRRQIRFIRFEENSPIEPFVTIDGLQAIAARTREWAGVDAPQFEVGKDHPDTPVSAAVTVYRMVAGKRCPFTAIVRWSEFSKRNKAGELSRTWRQMPFHMLAKVARANAIRMACPEETSGVFVEEEAPQE